MIRAEQPLARQKLPQHHRGRKNVHPSIDLRSPTASQLLGRHVRQLALHLAVVGDLQPALRFGDPKVCDPGDTVLADHDVLRRDIAVHDPQRRAGLTHRLVRRMKPSQHLPHDADRHGNRNLLPTTLRGSPQALQGFAPHVFHDEKNFTRLRNDVERRYHVGVLDA
jgi:hypothetical protein